MLVKDIGVHDEIRQAEEDEGMVHARTWSQARMMAGRVVTVKFVDDLGQIHLEVWGLALIPRADVYECF